MVGIKLVICPLTLCTEVEAKSDKSLINACLFGETSIYGLQKVIVFLLLHVFITPKRGTSTSFFFVSIKGK